MDLKVLMESLSKKDGDVSPAESIDEADENERPAPLTKRLNEFRSLDLGCDVVFLVGEKEKPINAHKLILACSSDVFKAMFYGLLSEFPHRLHRLDGSYQRPDDDDDERAASDSLDSVASSVSTSISSLSPESGRHSTVDDGENECENTDGDGNGDLDFDKKIHSVRVSPPTQNRYVSTEMCMLTDRRLPSAIQMVRVPDIAPSAFRKLIDFIYNDFDSKSVSLNDDNVMEVLYAAKKYAIYPLVAEAVRYLLNGLTAGNAVCLLAQARLFQEDSLISRCLDVIDRNTDLALQPQFVEEIDRDTLMELLSRTQLDPSSELIIYNAASAWAKAECSRRGVEPTIYNMRECLGSAIQLIRFPLMSVAEFGTVASSSLLSYEEIAEVFMYLAVKPKPFVRYPSGFRCSSRSKHCVNRFASVSSKRFGKRENRVCFSADRDIQVFGLGIYGLNTVKPHADEDNSWKCQVEIQLAAITDVNSYSAPLCCVASNTAFLQGVLGEETPYLASFAEPVSCVANQPYVASIRFVSENAIQTVSGKDGREVVAVDLPYDQTVNFKFSSYRSAYGDDGCKSEGQIPSLYFYVHWPENQCADK